MEALQETQPFAPFQSEGQYLTAKDLSTPRLSSRANIFKWGLKRPGSRLPEDSLFESHREFYSCLDIIADCQSTWESVDIMDSSSPPKIFTKYWKRDSLAVLQEILENPAIKDKCVWEPQKNYNSEGERVYTDMHTGDWWWDIQVISWFNSTDIRNKFLALILPNVQAVRSFLSYCLQTKQS